MFGVLAAAGVGYVTSQNPDARPDGVGVLIRVLIIGCLTVSAMYAQTSVMQRRMSLLLAGACWFSSLWLLNGSGGRLGFSVGVLFSGPALVAAHYLMLVHPSGALRSRQEARFLAIVGGAVLLLWTVATVTSTQPPLRTPLLGCAPHCPRNALFLGLRLDAVLPALRVAVRVLWIALTVGAIVLLDRRWRSASGPLRRSLLFVRMSAWAAGILLLAFLVSQSVGAEEPANAFGAAYIAMWAVIPLAILAGLASQRLFLGQALARFVSQLARHEDADPTALMAEMVDDPSLSIAYARPATGAYVDFLGAAVPEPAGRADRDVAWIERDGRPVAAVAYDRDLGDPARVHPGGGRRSAHAPRARPAVGRFAGIHGGAGCTPPSAGRNRRGRAKADRARSA
jgi:uncharacterized membrane protein